VQDEPDAASTELTAGAAALGVFLGDDAATLLLDYLERIYVWNRTAGLTTVARGDALRLHLLDSLSIVRFLPACGAFADLGSGAGLPGIPVAVALPDCTVTLVESRRRKCSFLTDTIRDLSLRNCRVNETNARRLADSPARYDAIMARAFVAPSDLVDIASGLLAPGGRLIVMGARRDADLDSVRSEGLARTADERFALPGGTERRRIVILEKPVAARPQTP